MAVLPIFASALKSWDLLINNTKESRSDCPLLRAGVI
jgi:hypothetical protein